LPAELSGNSYLQEGQLPPLPTTLEEAVQRFTASRVARDSFGDRFVDHYASVLRHEAQEYAAFVTDWERRHYLRFA
jgi:glutamine synthetase